jgi:hypothetical protein
VTEATRRVTAVFAGEGALRAALERLARHAPAARVVELRSAAPLSAELAELAPTRRSRAHVWGIAGGLAGGIAGLGLAIFTARIYPIATGHMPILAGPPAGILVFEGIALFAVLATTWCVLREGGLAPRRTGVAADDALAPGAIELTVEAAAADGDALRRILERPPG